ncbi:MAG: PmoA family protein [Rhodothermales bacterium]|nr:PmoA family protein [Rhodothermales bacterium]
MLRPLLCALACSSLLLGCQPPAPEWRLSVQAGEVDRRQSIVSFDLPAAPLPKGLEIVDESDRATPVQIEDGQGWFILDALDAGTSRTYTLRPTSANDYGIQATLADGVVSFADGDQPVLSYQSRPTALPDPGFDSVYVRGGYIYPLYTPSGVLVVDDYPPNHIHHHGIWSAWTSTEFEGQKPDFWNVALKTGRVEPVSLDSVGAGPVFSRLQARHRYVDLTRGSPRPVIDEQWDLRVFAVDAGDAPYRLVELRLRHTTATDSALILPEYHYGGLGFRGHRQWDGAENAFFLTSEGMDRSNGHETRARWSHIGGYVDGQLAGVGLLAHPDNFRAPEPMRIHPTEPFFCWSPSQAGAWAITPEQPYEAAYRFVVSDGPPDAELLERLWRDWAEPVRVMVRSE